MMIRLILFQNPMAAKSRSRRSKVKKGKKKRSGLKAGKQINKWSEDRMKGAILEYQEQVQP